MMLSKNTMMNDFKMSSRMLLRWLQQPNANNSGISNKHSYFQTVGFLSAFVNKGQSHPGVADGPRKFRENTNFFDILTKVGIDVFDGGEVVPILPKTLTTDEPVMGVLSPLHFCATSLSLADKVFHMLAGLDNVSSLKCPSLEEKREGDQLSLQASPQVHAVEVEDIAPESLGIVFGGDHSIGFGSILGHCRYHPNTCVIWVDAHADINTPISSPTGHTHGMPASFLLRQLEEEMPWIEEFQELQSCLDTDSITYIGLREIDPHEKYLLNKYGISYYTMADVDAEGMNMIIAKAIKDVNPRLRRPIHLSIDIDVLDPIYAPSTGTKAYGGLSLRELLTLCEAVQDTGKLSCVDLVEVNPHIGSPADVKLTLNTANLILQACIGISRSGYLPRQIISPASLGLSSLASIRNGA